MSPDHAGEPVIQLTGVERTFRLDAIQVRALRGVDLTIRRGEFVAVMGSSGSGKSTLMNIIGCLDTPTAGRYLLEGVDVEGLAEPQLAHVRSQRIGFVFQSFNLLPRTSALENVMLPLLYGASVTLTPKERDERARAVLARLGLADRERNTPNQLSGGQQQRVALARALINEPAILLADEPTGNLDTRTSHEIMQEIRRLNREEGVTVVLVTHEQDVAAFADRTIVMRDGEIISDTVNGHDGEPQPAPGVPPPEPASPAGADGGLTLPFLAMIFTAAAQALGRNRMRSALTALGVFIGVAALIAMVAVGDGASAAVKKQLERLGTNMVVIVPGARTTGGARGGFGSASTLTVADAEALQREGRAVQRVGYLNRSSGQVVNGDQNWTTSIQGVTASYVDILNWQIAAGRSVTDQDDQAAATVCLLGETVVQNLFGKDANPVGATVLVKGVPMRVVGRLAPRGQTGFGQDQDDVVMIPFRTAEAKVLGVASPQSAQNLVSATYPVPANPFGINPRLTGYVNSIYVQAAGADLVDAAIDQATATLKLRHHIQEGRDPDFSVRNLSQIAEAQAGSSQTMSVLLATVASISLLVGGVGIMNILLVSVTERTREIGIRMAIGARRLQVLLQFLVEAVLLSVAGGVAGELAGVVASWLISTVAKWPTQLSPAAMIGGFVFSAAVGVFFGFYPARKAARLNPIEALRFE
ncbi:MAG TPA: ABC transporter permease [Caulobacteraceae bacterium]|nr:ABC transporter permease [Caulobacteraceae bacterium]